MRSIRRAWPRLAASQRSLAAGDRRKILPAAARYRYAFCRRVGAAPRRSCAGDPGKRRPLAARMGRHVRAVVCRNRTLPRRVEQIERTCRDLFPDWHTSDWNRWTMPAEIPPAFRLGSGKLELARIKGGLSEDEKLRPAQTEFALAGAFAISATFAAAVEGQRSGTGQGGRCDAGGHAAICSRPCRRARSASRSSIRWGWARTSRPSCTWPTTTSSSSPAASGPTRRTSSSVWPT